MSAIADLIAAARRAGDQMPLTGWSDLADAAGKELARFHQALDRKESELSAFYSRERCATCGYFMGDGICTKCGTPKSGRLDLEALRKALGSVLQEDEHWTWTIAESRRYLRSLLAQLKGAKGQSGVTVPDFNVRRKHADDSAPKPKAQTCPSCLCYSDASCDRCAGTGKVGGGA